MADITDARKKQERRYVFCIVAMVAVCLAVAVMELSMGALSIDPTESVLALFGIGSAQNVNTVQSIRLPRTVCAPSYRVPALRLPAQHCKACWKIPSLPLPPSAFPKVRHSVPQ